MNPEDNLQIQVFNYLRYQYPRVWLVPVAKLKFKNMEINLEIQKSLEYLKYAIEQIVEKNNFYYHSKVHFKKDNYFKSGDKLLIENTLAKLGVGKIFFEDDNYFFTRQFNGMQYSKEEYFKNKEHSDMVKNGLYNKPYYGNKQLYKIISTTEA